jgi:Fe-S cluster assembly protein SufD
MPEAKAAQQDAYFAAFAAREKAAGREPAWLRSLRREALDRFGELGFPTTRVEEWRFTNVSAIANTRFEPARPVPAESVRKAFNTFALCELPCSRLVFVNGHYTPELSAVGRLPGGVKVSNLAAELAAGNPALEEHLGRHANFQNHPFIALNTAFIEDGAFIEVPKGVVLDEPIHLLYLSTGGGLPTMKHPRNLVVAGRESQATFIEDYAALDGGADFTNAVTEILAGENSSVRYLRLQHESEAAFHFGSLHPVLDRNANVRTLVVAFGAALARQEVNAVLDGEGAEARLDGLYLVSGAQHVDNYTTLDHAAPHTSSREFYKGVLDGKASGVFHGRIIVRKGAQKTDAKQSNKNLLLSDDATVNTKPQLEIYADDVKCTHGATIGQIDADAVFYLRSRGIGREEARGLLTYAFANEVLESIPFEPLRARLNDTLFARLSHRPHAGEEAWKPLEKP